MRLVRGVLVAVTALAAAYLGWVYLSRQVSRPTRQAAVDPERARREAEILSIYGSTDLRILLFFSPTGDLAEGHRTTICYGVLNAKSVRIEPPVDGVGPSIHRCVAVAPEEDTRYTLIAEGRDGSVASQSFVIRTHPDPYTLPNIKNFQIVRAAPDRSRPAFLLSFQVENAEEVSVKPKAFPPIRRAPNGRFYVAPEKTTTYTLTVVGKKGRKVQQQLTVEVPVKTVSE